MRKIDAVGDFFPPYPLQHVGRAHQTVGLALVYYMNLSATVCSKVDPSCVMRAICLITVCTEVWPWLAARSVVLGVFVRPNVGCDVMNRRWL